MIELPSDAPAATEGRALQRGAAGPRPSGPAGDGRGETEPERDDRNLSELTGELRVVVTGVQVLFAFLLVVPFDVGFDRAKAFERTAYFVTLMFAAGAAVCLVAPAAWHRLLFRRNEKEYLVLASNRVVVAGLVCLGTAICGSILVVATQLYGSGAGIASAIASGLVIGLMWFVSPLARR